MPSVFLYILVFIFGSAIGSFLNSIIYRMEINRGFPLGRSYCPHCKHTLKWYDLVPVFSFLFLQGKCRYCHKKISWQYPLVELATGLIFLLVYQSNWNLELFGSELRAELFTTWNLVTLCFMFYVSSSMIVIFVYDLKHYIIPDKILFPAIIVSVFYRLFENLTQWSLISNWSWKIDNFALIINYFFAAFIASVFFLLIFIISKGNWIGFGDVKLAVLMGLLLGFPNVLVGLFLAFLFGAIIGLALIILQKKYLKSQIPFAPFLIIGTFIGMFWGQEIIDFYMSFFLF